MGAIWMSGAQFVGGIGEFVGYKLGLAVTEDELHRALVDAGLADAWPGEADAMYRYRSEVYEEVTETVLAAFGDPDAQSIGPSPVLDVLRAVPEPQRALAEDVIQSTLELMARADSCGGSQHGDGLRLPIGRGSTPPRCCRHPDRD